VTRNVAGIALMCEHAIGADPAFSDGRLAGIPSRRHCVRRVMARGVDPASVPVTAPSN